jgi:DNA repair protein RadC
MIAAGGYMRIPYFVTRYSARNPMIQIPKYRVSLVQEGELEVKSRTVGGAGDVYEFLRPLTQDLDREAFFVVYLNTKNLIIGVNMASLGSLALTVVHAREVMKPAVLVNASKFICLHNHPSGDPTPSRSDRMLVYQMAAAGEVMGIAMLDFVVAGETTYWSAAERGAIPSVSVAELPGICSGYKEFAAEGGY